MRICFAHKNVVGASLHVVWYHRHYLKLTPYSTMLEHDSTSHNFQSILNENAEKQKKIT